MPGLHRAARHQVAAEVARAQLHRGATPAPGCSVAHPAFVDAPVSGGVPGASAATLSFMARPWLQAWLWGAVGLEEAMCRRHAWLAYVLHD